jgi:hypothetical protein
MNDNGNRIIVLIPESGISYDDVAKVRDVLTKLQINGKISNIYELVKEGEKSEKNTNYE